MRVDVVKGLRSVMSARSGITATLQTMVVRVLVIALNMATGILTARVLGPDGRGEQAAMLLWPQFLAFTITLGMPVSLIYNLKKYPEDRSKLFAAALIMACGLGGIASLIGIIFMPRWLSQYSPEIITMAQWFMLTAPLSLLGITFRAAFTALDEFTIANQIRYVVPLATFLMLVGLVVSDRLTSITAALAYLLPSFPIMVWMLMRLWPRFQPRWRGLTDSFKKLTHYGLRSYGIDLLGVLSDRVGQALVVGFLSAASMGLYTIAFGLSRVLNTFEDAIISVLLPKTAARPLEEVVALTGRAARVSTCLTVLAVVPLMILGPFFLELLYGDRFTAAVPVFRILLIEVLLTGTTWVLAQTFMAVDRPGTLTGLQGIGLGVSVILTVLFVHPHFLNMGMVGAGWALLASTATRLVFVLISYPLVLKVPCPSCLLNGDDIAYVKEKLIKQM